MTALEGRLHHLSDGYLKGLEKESINTGKNGVGEERSWIVTKIDQT